MDKSCSINIAAIALLATLSFYLPSAEAATDKYFNVLYAFAAVNNPDTEHKADGSAVVTTLGFPTPNVSHYLSFEGEYSTTTNKPTYGAHTHYNLGIFGGSYDFDYSETTDYYTLAGYAVVTYPNEGSDNIRARVGLLYKNEHTDIYENNNGSVINSSTARSGVGLSFSLGTLYSLSSHLRFMLEGTYVDRDITHLSTGFQFIF